MCFCSVINISVDHSLCRPILTTVLMYYTIFIVAVPYRPLSRRLDRCDRVIQKESGDPNGGNMCSFSWATGTSRVRHNADYVPCAQICFDL